jgi:hypothetical protein
MAIRLLALCLLVLTVLNQTMPSARYYAQGTFSQEMMSTITMYIAGSASQTNLNSVSRSMYNALNAGFGANWNIITVSQDTNLAPGDAVVFGYAFNGRWLWIDNFGASNLSMIIWKDYNCGVNTNFTYTPAINGFLTSEKLPTRGFNQFTRLPSIRNKILIDPNTAQANSWDNAVRISDAVNAFYEGSYSVVVTENVASFNAYICTFSDASYTGPNYFVNTF